MKKRKLLDLIVEKAMLLACLFIVSIVFIVAIGLYFKARPILLINNLAALLFSSNWHPTTGQFGLSLFIISTLWVTMMAMIFAVPLSILSAIYISEYAPKKFKEIANTLVDLLAGISPVIYGVWGVIVIVPFVRDYLKPFISLILPFPPFLSNNFTGFSVLSASMVLAVMISPIIISIVNEVLKTIPKELKEASLSLGATKWETTKLVVIRKALPGIIAAIILGLSRAFGETMAVLMVAGCSMFIIPASIFDSAYPLPALIANTYGEMMSIPLYAAAVFFAALMLLSVSVIFNLIGWGVLLRMKNNE